MFQWRDSRPMLIPPNLHYKHVPVWYKGTWFFKRYHRESLDSEFRLIEDPVRKERRCLNVHN